jgi:hypothetical protein
MVSDLELSVLGLSQRHVVDDDTGQLFGAWVYIADSANRHMQWDACPKTPPRPSLHTFPLYNVALHEVGHAIGLDHALGDEAAVMWESFPPGDVVRDFVCADAELMVEAYHNLSVRCERVMGKNVPLFWGAASPPVQTTLSPGVTRDEEATHTDDWPYRWSTTWIVAFTLTLFCVLVALPGGGYYYYRYYYYTPLPVPTVVQL